MLTSNFLRKSSMRRKKEDFQTLSSDIACCVLLIMCLAKLNQPYSPVKYVGCFFSSSNKHCPSSSLLTSIIVSVCLDQFNL